MRRPSAYRVYLTRNSEYHVRGLVCFGVRDRRSGAWLAGHWALKHNLAGTFADATGHMRAVELPVVGEPLRFIIDDETRETTPVLGVEERIHLELDSTAALGRTPPESLTRPRINPAASSRETQ